MLLVKTKTVKVGNHPYTNMISKPAIVRRGGYKCRSLYIYIYRLLYQNLMVITNQKSTIDTQTRKSNPNTTLNIVPKP